jgi:hypothetical protein
VRERFLKIQVGWLAILLTLACGPVPVPLDDSDPFSELVPNVDLGLRAADFLPLRPNLEVHGDGTYRESFDRHDLIYHFSPRQPQREPPLTARLIAIESRENMFDSVNLWPEWRRLVEERTARGTAPECISMGDERATVSRALYTDSVRFSIAAEIWRAPDGQDHEAFLVTRIGLEPVLSEEEYAFRESYVECKDLGLTGVR